MKHAWFKAKKHSWNCWHPLRWQGRLVIVIYAILMIAAFSRLGDRSHVDNGIIAYVPLALVGLTALFLIVCFFTQEHHHK